ncbi:high mobility group nucleosome-binding domain-containing protein 5-like [Branchiostoma lanceolatum]|uniref:high mobility group nucleosome-binding domain-containing protein 5-like n=1 Tax=Branchiostoma lanceolatum TaxID=7740 RepID=UPI003456304D
MELHELNMMRASEVCRRQEISFDPDKYHEEPLPSVSRSREAVSGREHADFKRHGNTQPNVEEKKYIKTRAAIDRKLSPPRKKSVASGRKIEETFSPCDSEVDELEELYETRKTEAFPTAVGSMQNVPPHRTDVSCRPKDPLYVRRVGLRFWSTKRILDWQRQSLRAVEDTEAVLKPVREYGEESASKDTGITVFQSHDVADLDECPTAAGKRGCTQQDKNDNADYENSKEHTHYENNEKQEHYENNEENNHRENNKELGHYGNDTNHRHYENNKEDGHEENNAEHKYYQYDKNHSHYDEEYGHYKNDKEHYENDKEHGHYENDREHGHYENDREHGHYENNREHGHYENDKEHGHYENDREYGHYENDREHGHYENDKEHGHHENKREHKYFHRTYQQTSIPT